MRKETARNTILIVDDAKENHLLLKAGLGLENKYSILTALSGEEALKIVAEQGIPDLAIIDIMMSTMDGYELIAALRIIDVNLPIIVLTALRDEQYVTRGIELGADAFFSKPVPRKALLAQIRALLNRRSYRSDEGLYHQIQTYQQTITHLRSQLSQQEQQIKYLQLSQPLSPHTNNDDILSLEDDIDLFVSGLLHHLSNLIGPIKIFVQRAQKGQQPQVYLEKIESQVNRAIQIITKLQTSTISLQPEPVKLLEVIQIAQMQVPFPDDITLKINIAEDANDVISNQEALLRVLENLFLNAVQSMGERGTLQITSQRVTKQWVEIYVSDTGSGIPPELQTKLFEPFFTTKKQEGGQGIGLWLSKRLIERVGGFLGLAESTLGEGTTFLIKLRAVTKDSKVVAENNES